MSKKELSKEERAAMAMAIETGVELSKNGYTVYWSNGSQAYCVLNLNGRGPDFEEEAYPDINDAISKFSERALLNG